MTGTMGRRGVIIDRIDGRIDGRPGGWVDGAPGSRRPDFALLCPHFSGMDATLADLIGCLPIGDANAAILAAARALPAGGAIYAGILAADPFRPASALLGALKDCGVAAVVNLPTVALAGDGLGRALSHAGIDHAAELRTLARAAALGLDTMAVVSTAAQGLAAVAAGVPTVMVHPGLADLDPDVNRGRADRVAATVGALRTAAGVRILVFRHPGFGRLLDPVADRADGIVEWAVPSGDPAR